ncbi:MAG: glycosyltransferase family 4 protein [Pseudomonadota bacterium]
MKRLVWFAVARTPYTDYLYDEVGKNTDLKVVYSIKDLNTHPWQLPPPRHSYQFVDDDFSRSFGLMRKADAIVFTGWIFWKYLLLMRLAPSKTPMAFWTDTPKSRPRKWPKRILRNFVVQDIFRRFDHVWSTGNVGCVALGELGCPKHKIHSLPTFPNLERFSMITPEQCTTAKQLRKKYGASNSKTVVFLCVGQLIKLKRFEDAICALAALDRSDCVLWFAGAGPEESTLRKISHELGVANRVFFLGWRQPPEDLENTYLAADVFVHPANLDSFPNAVLEAMAWAKPVIGSNGTGAVVDRVIHGENGFICSPGHVDCIRQSMAHFLHNRSEIKTFGQKARVTALQHPVSQAIDLVYELLAVVK